MMARDPQGLVEWLSLHDPSVAARFPGIDRDDAMRQMYVYAPDGSLFKGAEGWRELFHVLRGLSWAAALYKIPGVSFVMDRVYRFVASRRYRLSCAGAACRRPAEGGSASAGTRTRLGVVVLALLVPLSLCSGFASGCSGGPRDPVAERLDAIADPEATAVVVAVF